MYDKETAYTRFTASGSLTPRRLYAASESAILAIDRRTVTCGALSNSQCEVSDNVVSTEQH